MECHRGAEYFTITELDGAVLSFTMPLGKDTPEEVVMSMYNDTYLNLQKSLVGTAKVCMSREADNRILVSLKMLQPYPCHQMLGLIGSCFKYRYEVEIPLCLYMLKAEIMTRIRQIMDQTGSLVFVRMSSRVSVLVYGGEKACLAARMEVFRMVEEMLGRETTVTNASMPVGSFLEQNARAFPRSRINCDEVLISQQRLSFVPEDVPFVVERLTLDTQKLFYLLVYRRGEMEDILSSTQSYMTTEEQSQGTTSVVLKGFDVYEVRRAKDEMNCMYNRVMKMVTEDMGHVSGDDIIVFRPKNGRRMLAVGDRGALVRMIPVDGALVEAEMDIEMETVEFLCGKKNGKITRIMKDVSCTIAIHRRPERSRASLTVSGSGEVFRSALDMIEDEFPEELTFCIDEKYHKRIIGYGGRNIQKIMKKHGVYIKFMSERERRRVGYRDNVVIKTPRKNVENLVSMKNDVMSLIGDADEETRSVESPVSFFDFYDLVHGSYRFLYDKVLVVDTERAVDPVLCYLRDGSYHCVSDDHQCVFKIERTGQWFVKTTRTLPLERISTVHWIGSVENMPTFSWLFGHDYSSLFHSSKDGDGEVPQDVCVSRQSLWPRE